MCTFRHQSCDSHRSVCWRGIYIENPNRNLILWFQVNIRNGYELVLPPISDVYLRHRLSIYFDCERLRTSIFAVRCFGNGNSRNDQKPVEADPLKTTKQCGRKPKCDRLA